MNRVDLAATASSTVILPTDFNTNTADKDRHQWTAGQLRHVVAALSGARVAITIDKQTGHTLVGVKLVEVVSDAPHHGLVIEHPDGSKTRYWIPAIGSAIIPLEDPIGNGGGAKWRALGMERQEAGAALDLVRAKYGESAGREWGRWTVTPTLYGSVVRYEPITTNAAYADKWGTSLSAEISRGQIVRVFEGRPVKAKPLMNATPEWMQ